MDGKPGLAVGWGASMGTVERRGISLALLDAAMQADGELREQLVLDEQTVIAATDGSATNGFVEHLRLPPLRRLRRVPRGRNRLMALRS